MDASMCQPHPMNSGLCGKYSNRGRYKGTTQRYMELTIQLPDGEIRLGITGPAERNLKMIREALGIVVTARNGSLRLSGESGAVGRAAHVLERLSEAAQKQHPLNRQELLETIASATARPDHLVNGQQTANHDMASEKPRDRLEVYLHGKSIKAVTPGQRTYLHAIQQHDLTFCTGPAGTGKTYLAVAASVDMLKRGQVRRLVLCRPAVEAGEKLGYLPGTMQEKVNPYLRPLLDALHDMMEFDHVQRFMSCDVIEIVPLAFMRGRTLNDAMIILDEAQNATRGQMLMFLTRMGMGSKMVVTGDTSQTDLPDARESGLVDALHRLRYVKGVERVTLSGADIVRHSLVQRVVEAYDKHHDGRKSAQDEHLQGDAGNSRNKKSLEAEADISGKNR